MLLFENHLSHEINSLLMNENRLRIAVAFIGDGASQRINPNAKDVQIICNLTMNGTNPAEVQNLIHRFGSGSIKQIDNLHAKLYIGSEYAIVGSANLSANGLGTQPTALREAGYKFKLDQPSGRRSLDWFNDALWGDAREITAQDLQDAAERWKRRDFDRNGSWQGSLRSICDYDFDREDFPLIDWWCSAEWSISEKLAQGRTKDQCEKIKKEVDNSINIGSYIDQSLLEKGRYVFYFQNLKTSGLASQRANNWCILRSKGIILRQAYHCDDEPGEEIDVMLSDQVSGLFGLNKQKNYEKFRDLINSGKYKKLREYDPKSWFHPRIELMREFWKELQSQLCSK